MFQKTEKKSERLINKLFIIDSDNYLFFRNCLNELSKTKEGENLLRSLNANFKGKKLTLKAQTDLNTDLENAKGYFSDNPLQIMIRKKSLLKNNPFQPKKENYQKVLFHELTHWNQYQNEATAWNTITQRDKFFTLIMEEADAQASGDLFELEQQRIPHLTRWIYNPAQQLLEITASKLNSNKRFITKKEKELKEKHPNWTKEQIEKEAKKTFLKKTITQKNLSWRQVYEDPKIINTAISESKADIYSKKEFPDVMKYYMIKYGLTIDECFELKKEILAQSGLDFSEGIIKKQEKEEQNVSIKDILQNASSDIQREVKNTPIISSVKKVSASLKKEFLSRIGRGGQGG